MAQVASTHDTMEDTSIQAIHGFRYQVKDITRSVEFYTGHLGLLDGILKISEKYTSPPLRALHWATLKSFSAAQAHLARAKCPMANARNRAVGIV